MYMCSLSSTNKQLAKQSLSHDSKAIVPYQYANIWWHTYRLQYMKLLHTTNQI